MFLVDYEASGRQKIIDLSLVESKQYIFLIIIIIIINGWMDGSWKLGHFTWRCFCINLKVLSNTYS